MFTATFQHISENDLSTQFTQDKAGHFGESQISEVTSLFLQPRRLVTSKQRQMQRVTIYIKWREINGFPDYLVSSTGIVRKRGGDILKQFSKKYGYRYVFLYRKIMGVKECKKFDVHRLVWNAFGDTPHKKGYEIHHIDEDKTNNNISNLRLLPMKEHRSIHKTLLQYKG